MFNFNNDLIEKIKKYDLTFIVPIVFLIAIWVTIFTVNPLFLNLRSILSVLVTAVPLIICAFGVTHVIRLGSIDLSIEGQAAFSAVLVSFLLQNNFNNLDLGFWAVIIAIAATTLIGALNGIIHTQVKIPSFISSFGLGAIATGAAILIYRGEPISITDNAFRGFFTNWNFNIPNILIITLVVFLFLYFLQKKTIIGTYVDAIGGDEKLTRLNGIPVNKFKIISFAIAGFCYGIAGVILAARLGTGTADLSSGLLLNGIASVLLGGTALQGGNGGVVRTLIGAVIISSLKTGIIVLRINPYFQEGFIGIVLIAVLLLGAKRGKLVINK